MPKLRLQRVVSENHMNSDTATPASSERKQIMLYAYYCANDNHIKSLTNVFQ